MYATYMRLEKRPGCRLLSPLPERPIQASNNHCSNTAAYLYTFYQKFKPDSKNTEPIPPYSPTLSIPRPPPTVIPSAARNPKPKPPPPFPRHTPRPHPRIPREGGGPRRPQDDQAPRSPHPSFPPAHPSFPRTRESRPRTASNPRTATRPRIPREGGGPPRPPQTAPRPTRLAFTPGRTLAC